MKCRQLNAKGIDKIIDGASLDGTFVQYDWQDPDRDSRANGRSVKFMSLGGWVVTVTILKMKCKAWLLRRLKKQQAELVELDYLLWFALAGALGLGVVCSLVFFALVEPAFVRYFNENKAAGTPLCAQAGELLVFHRSFSKALSPSSSPIRKAFLRQSAI